MPPTTSWPGSGNTAPESAPGPGNISSPRTLSTCLSSLLPFPPPTQSIPPTAAGLSCHSLWGRIPVCDLPLPCSRQPVTPPLPEDAGHVPRSAQHLCARSPKACMAPAHGCPSYISDLLPEAFLVNSTSVAPRPPLVYSRSFSCLFSTEHLTATDHLSPTPERNFHEAGISALFPVVTPAPRTGVACSRRALRKLTGEEREGILTGT